MINSCVVLGIFILLKLIVVLCSVFGEKVG